MTIPTTLPLDLADYNFCVTLNFNNGETCTYESVESLPYVVGNFLAFDHDESMVAIDIYKIDTVDIHAILKVQHHFDIDPLLSPVVPISAYVYRSKGRHHV